MVFDVYKYVCIIITMIMYAMINSNRKYAFSLLKQAGCWLTTTESAILSLAGGSHHPQFKQLQALIKAEGPDTGLLSKI